MLALHKLQQTFSSAMLRHDEEDLAGLVAPGDITPELRLRIYRNNVLSSMIGAMGELFPIVKQLVGDDFFKALAREFVLAQPPGSGRLGEYGAGFPSFLRDFPPAQQLAYLPDVAIVELAWLKAYRAADAESVSADALGHVAPEDMPRLTLELHPSAILLKTGHPAGRIWHANQTKVADSAKVEIGDGADHLLIIRPDDTVEVRLLDPSRFVFLSALTSGDTIVAAFEAATSIDPAFELDRALTDFITGGVFASFALADIPPNPLEPPHEPDPNP